MNSMLRRLAKKISRREIRRELDIFLNEIPDGSLVLNIGSGGEIAEIIRKHNGITAKSSDIDQQRRPDIVDDITNSLIPDESYHAVVMCEVLEHVTDPINAIKNVRRILKVGGRAFISVPFMFPTHDAPYDYFRYTEFGLRRLLSTFANSTINARGSIASTVMLLALRGLWLKDRNDRIITTILSLWLLPVFAITYPLSRKRVTLGYCSGFICTVDK